MKRKNSKEDDDRNCFIYLVDKFLDLIKVCCSKIDPLVCSSDDGVDETVLTQRRDTDAVAWTTGTREERSLNSIGSGVTVAMVSVALGFACCENLMYVFVYNGYNVGTQVTVLVARSLFPVHPLAAAIQSIGVCRRDLEGERRLRLGNIILPSVIMHGSFDFVLMLVSFLITVHDDGSGAGWFGTTTEVMGFLSAICIILMGGVYFLTESLKQKRRLAEMQLNKDAGVTGRLV